MFTRRTLLVAVAASLPSLAFAAGGHNPMRFDGDNDGTLDLDEVHKAASEHFDKLDTDKDGTLDPKETRRILNGTAFRNADPDKDGTISKDEYLALVEQRFHAADTDGDGTVDRKELTSTAGKALLRLLQ
jgi:Ca2+-binding EF-hand superfamily protein